MSAQNLEVKINVAATQGVAAVGAQAEAFARLRQQVSLAQVSLSRMTVAVAAGQAVFSALTEVATAVFRDLPRALLQGALAAEKMDRAFAVLEGSLGAARDQIAFVRAEAQRLGIPLAEASEAWLRLSAAARGTALEGEETRRIFSAVAGASSTLGLSAAETSGALLAISQMMSKGTVQAEELRGQLGERIPGAFGIAARAMGVSTQALGEMLDRGGVLATDFLPRFAAQLAREIPASADGTQNAINRLGNATEEWRRLTGSALAVAIDDFHGLKSAAGELGRDTQIVEWARKSAKGIAMLVDVLRELILFTPNVLRTIGGSLSAVGRDIKFAFDVAATAVAQGIGDKGRAAMKRALDERNAFIAEYNQDLSARWFPKMLSERVDEFFASLSKQQAAGAAKAGLYLEGELSREQQKTLDAIKSKEEKLAAEYKAHAGNLYAALTSGALGIDEYNRQRARLDAWYRQQQAKAARVPARLPHFVESFDAELDALKAGLKNAEGLLEASFHARFISEQDYWRAKGEQQRQALDLEEQELRAKITDQERLITSLTRIRPKDATQREELAGRIQEAGNKLADFSVRLDALSGRRVVVELEVQTNIDRVKKEIDDLKASLREKIAEATGESTPEMRRAAIERANREMLAKMAGDAEGERLAKRWFDVEAAKGDMAALEKDWRLALETMRNAEQSAGIQREQGLITTADAQERIAQAHRAAAASMDDLLPKLDAVANTLGREAVARVAAFKNELAGIQGVVDPVAASINASLKQGFEDMFAAVGSGARNAKEAFLDFARSVISAINRIAAQKLAESLFGSGKGAEGGLGAMISAGLKFIGIGKADGGYVSGPGTSTSDSIPARLSAGEYVLRAEAVRRLGVSLLDAINGGPFPARPTGARMAFAAGGLVREPAPASQPAQSLRIVNVLDPAVVGDYLGSPSGERVLVNVLRRNSAQLRTLIS